MKPCREFRWEADASSGTSNLEQHTYSAGRRVPTSGLELAVLVLVFGSCALHESPPTKESSREGQVRLGTLHEWYETGSILVFV